MLPIATPPNAVVFGSGRIKINDMIKAGLWLNIVSMLIITLVSLLVLGYVFDTEIGVLPLWISG
jgi:sodium-dependent dicarboxylate transporter 2/3/5